MAGTEIHYVITQRREGVTLPGGEYYYMVTTVVSGVNIKGTSTPLSASGPDDVPYLNLFHMNTAMASSMSDRLVSDSVVFDSVASPEDFTNSDALASGTSWLKKPRAFFPSAVDPNPMVGSGHTPPADLELGDLTVVYPTGGAGPCAGAEPCDDYVSNVRIDAFPALPDAVLAADAIVYAVRVFERRYNNIVASFGTSVPGSSSGYVEV